METF
jgi:hypothetical protein